MLYVCPTPIGNLEDITLRSLRMLREVELILAEDTRRTRRLLHHFEISCSLESFHEHNEKQKTDRILALLREERKIALVCDAGMPALSDPGSWLIKKVIEANLPLTVLPGANAALVAFVQSGFGDPPFLFYGFLPRHRGERQKALATVKDHPYPTVFYEAPHRLRETLDDLSEILGERQVSVSRELTKRYEETKRGSLTELADVFADQEPRGEFVITVQGANSALAPPETEDDILGTLKELIDSGLSRKTAIAQVSAAYRLPKNQVYEIALRIRLEG